jgi:hypothetical protein
VAGSPAGAAAREAPTALRRVSEQRESANGHDRRIADRDEQVLANLKANPNDSIAQRARDLGCTRSTVTEALRRLAIADMAQKTGRGTWIVTEPAPAIPAETARWIGKPLSATSDRRKRHDADEEAEEAIHA